MPTVFRQHPKLGVLSTSSAKRIKVGRMYVSTSILLSVQYLLNCSNVNESLIRSFLQVCTSSSRRFPRSKKNATRNGPADADAIPGRARAGQAKPQPASAGQQSSAEGGRAAHQCSCKLGAQGPDWRAEKRARLTNPEQRGGQQWSSCILKWAHREPGGACLKPPTAFDFKLKANSEKC